MSDEGKKTMAIIKDVRCGVGDRGRAWLQFSTYCSEASAALQIIEWEDAKDVIEAYGVSDVSQLEGKPCWVDISAPGLITWIGAFV